MFYNIRIKYIDKYTYPNKLLYLCTISLKRIYEKNNDIFYINAGAENP